MAYIGRTPAYGYFEKDLHTGDGIVSQFNLTYPVASPNQLLVSLDGVIQEPDYSYNVTMVSGQAKINFSEAPDIGARIFIVYVGRQLLTAGSNAPSSYLDEFDGDNSTTVFTLTRTPATTDAANFIVYVDNVYQREGSSYAYTVSGENITFTSPPPTGTNNIQVYQLSLSNEVNTVSDGTVSEAKLANGAVTENKIADNAVTENKIADQSITADKIHPSVPLNNFRNLLINGDMRIAQRGFGVNSYSTDSYATVDRWLIRAIDLSGQSFELTRPNEAPSGTGLAHSFKMENNTIIPNAATTWVAIDQRLEGQFLQHLMYGTSDAKSLTVSFWVKTNKEGEYTSHLYSNDNSGRHINSFFTISAGEVDTWVYKTITFAGDTAFALDDDNLESLRIAFVLQAGSNYTSGSQDTSWSTYTTGNVASDNQVVFGAEANNYWQITGIQLEEGNTATPFEHRPLDVELHRCQRYFEKSYNYKTSPGTNTVTGYYQSRDGTSSNVSRYYPLIYKVTKRAIPTVTIYDGVGNVNRITLDSTNNLLAGLSAVGDNSCMVYANVSPPSHYGGYFHFTINAEL